MTRILCVGNRLVEADSAGLAVHDALAARSLPPGVELVDGGLGGLRLLSLLDGAGRVVLVDTVSGFTDAGGVVQLAREQLAAPERCDHDSGLAWLLAQLPRLCERDVPELSIVGLEAPADADTVARATALCLRLVGGEA